MASRLSAPLPDEVYERYYSEHPEAEVLPGHEGMAALARGRSWTQASLAQEPKDGEMLDEFIRRATPDR